MFTFNKHKRHIQGKIEVTQKKIWDLEFLKEKLKAMREGFRQEYDRLQEQVDAATLRLEVENKKEDADKTIVENLTKFKERIDPDIGQLKTQMAAVESQIEGDNGVNQSIDGLRTVLGMLVEYKKTI